jgi:hypothetical protein
VLRLIAAHVRDGSSQSWRGYDLDFTGAVIDQADSVVRVSPAEIIFINPLFVGHGRGQAVFDDVEFANGSSVYFRLAEFRSSKVRPDRATSAAAGSPSTVPASPALRWVPRGLYRAKTRHLFGDLEFPRYQRSGHDRWLCCFDCCI